MYNLYFVEKKAAERTGITPDPVIRSKTRDKLTARYRNRINNSLLLMNEQVNSPICRSKSPEVTFRLTMPKIGKRTQRSPSAEIDTTPSPKHAFNLRPREKQKEIQPNLKFKFFGKELLKDCLDVQRKFLDTSLDPQSTFRSLKKDYYGNEKTRFSGGKNVDGYYHYKVHFKTIESVALDLHQSTRNESRAEINKKKNDEGLGFRSKSHQKPQNRVCKEDIIPISSNVLEKYGVWKEKSKLKSHFQISSLRVTPSS